MAIPLPAVIQLAEVVLPNIVEEKKEADKRVVLCITRDIADEDLAMLKEYGKVLSYDHDLHNNLDCDAFEWAYLIIDLRESEDRYYYLKNILPKKNKYSVAVYHYPFEDDEFIEADNYFTSFPKKQATRAIFNNLLMIGRIKKPRPAVSLFKCCLNVYSKVK
jgi:hypothetical protein